MAPSMPGVDANMKVFYIKEEEARQAQQPVALEASGKGQGGGVTTCPMFSQTETLAQQQ